MSTDKLQNIEQIIKTIKGKCKEVIKIRKGDGITMICYTATGASLKKAIEEIIKISNSLNLNPNDYQEINDNSFFFQYPELDPIYTESEIKKMYTNNFKFLLDNLFKIDKDKKVTKELLILQGNSLIKNAITTYFRSNTNMYRTKLEDYLANDEYRNKVANIYYNYLDEFISKKEEKDV